MDEWLRTSDNWPTFEENALRFIQDQLDYLENKVKNCVKTCIICDGPLECEMIKPSVCSKKLCIYSHEQYGLGADLTSEIRENPDVVDLLVTLACSA